MLIVAGVIIVILLIIIVKIIISNNVNQSELEEDLDNLKSKIKELHEEIESNKLFYGKDRQLLIAEHEGEKVKLEYLQKELKQFTKQQQNYYAEMDNLSSHNKEMSPEELILLHSKVDIAGSGVLDFTGIYILENKTVDKYYVGQSITVIRRVAKHFTEKGNEDIYEDYMNGETWTIKLIALSNSGFKSINALEKHFIEYYHSTYNGYNRTVGNRT